jgi:transcription initiation factor TFIIIB Brf1 subunit/transcription initiation factor TFIIB
MSKCRDCGKANASYAYSEGGYLCGNCVGDHFSCPDCGQTFPDQSYDAGNGYCSDCAPNH